MSDTAFDMAVNNAKKLGECLGVMKFLIEHGDLTDYNWGQLSRTYVNVTGEDLYSQDTIVWIRAEAIRRGVDIG